MAIVRCENCGLKTSRTELDYHNEPYLPIGYPDTGVICGAPDCKNPGKVWLEEVEFRSYKKGERVFGIKTNTVKIKIK
jgi:hypothetical protein